MGASGELDKNAIGSPLELTFRLNEIFYSIQGEGMRSGIPCVFVRLHGCKLRCSYCDTLYAIDRRKGGRMVLGADIDREVRAYRCRFIEFTGGEPLEQPHVFPLMRYYCDQGYTVAVETGGHIDIAPCDERVIRIVDMKCPGSKMEPLNKYRNLDLITARDEVKFVISDRTDFEWARDLMLQHKLHERSAAALFSPAFGALDNRTLAEWILAERLPARMQLQIHKYIWDPDARGV